MLLCRAARRRLPLRCAASISLQARENRALRPLAVCCFISQRRAQAARVMCNAMRASFRRSISDDGKRKYVAHLLFRTNVTRIFFAHGILLIRAAYEDSAAIDDDRIRQDH